MLADLERAPDPYLTPILLMLAIVLMAVLAAVIYHLVTRRH